MHSKFLISCLFALPCASAILNYCIPGINVTLGDKCILEGNEYCNHDCSSAIACTSGAYQLMKTCERNSCNWDEDNGSASCRFKPPEPRMPDHTPEPALAGIFESTSECLPTFRIGASCDNKPGAEGQMRCDETCTSVGICHDGIFQINSPCAPGRYQHWSDNDARSHPSELSQSPTFSMEGVADSMLFETSVYFGINRRIPRGKAMRGCMS
ncbi:hypothetical protein J7T55_001089 [Diaporthe amygdali]|uniref:uncharacterized protein n=1 Tax=Phomopsis amygdali TaxID=1214568 RepID=UPI0022FF286F|nr:uncharacterized protein J7T55_001089 [Diaporthe amygdali]KAJ0120232.1 hypothetical protein J7T55_001089 [Diaporthe amygdali]